MRVLNLYAGIGGNRKLWTDVEVTAVELNPEIANIYQDFYPNDTVIIGDAHQYLLDHFKEFDFIWASPPCPTHSKMNRTNYYKYGILKYPDMSLYQEIILLKEWFKGKYCVENVITYYDPLITPIESGSHYYWTNFKIRKLLNMKRGIGGIDHKINFRTHLLNIDLTHLNISNKLKTKVLNNCVEPETGLHILDCARGVIREENVDQLKIF